MKAMIYRYLNNRLLATAALLALLSGCSGEMPDSTVHADAGAGGKIINTPSGAVPGTLLLHLDADAAESAASAVTKGGTVAACDARMAGVFSEVGATSLERVFVPIDDRHAGILHKYGLDRWYVLRFPEDEDVEEVAAAVSDLGNVEYLQYNTRIKQASDGVSAEYEPVTRVSLANPSVFNDEMLRDQWHYENTGDAAVSSSARAGADINVRDAWRLTAGDPDIIVAVLDEAVQWDHPDLEANMWTGADGVHGYNCTVEPGTDGFTDLDWSSPGNVGHGTHVAGTIAAVNNNGTGVCGIAGGTGHNDGVKILSLQIMDGINGADDIASSRAISYAVAAGAHIINGSWGYEVGEIMSDYEFAVTSRATLTAAALNMFVSEPNDVLDGGIAIFASGNDAAGISAYPAAYGQCLSVTAFAPDNCPAYYTNYGPGCNIAAPGGEDYSNGTRTRTTQILSTMPTVSLPIFNDYGEDTGQMSAAEYGYMQGTSMACPHVSGVAALGLSYAKKLGKTFTREEFVSMLLSSVNDIDRFCHGTRYTMNSAAGVFGLVDQNKYRGKMGTGSIDAWKLLMNIEGTPFITAKAGELQQIPLDSFFGSGASGMTFVEVEISDADRKALGLVSSPVVRNGKLEIFPLLTGSAKMTVHAVGGGDSLSGGYGMGGTDISREISVIVRNIPSSNGGWL